MLIGVAILIRWESFVLIAIGFFTYLTFLDQKFLKDQTRLLIAISALFIVLYTAHASWVGNSRYAEFAAYNKMRAAVSDHPVTYRLMKKKPIDIEPKWFFFSQWMMDDDAISMEELKNRKATLDAELFSLAQMQSSIARLTEVLKAESFKSVFSVLIILMYLFSGKKSLNKLIFGLFWMLFFLIFNHFFVLNGRVIILFILPLSYYSLRNSSDFSKRLNFLFFPILSFLLIFHFYNFFQEAKGRAQMRAEFQEIISLIPSGELVVLEGYKENYLGIPFTSRNKVPLLSFGWISKSPFQRKALDRFGLEKLSQAKKFNLIGVDVNKEFFFPDYMNSLSGQYELRERIDFPNFILFSYQEKQ